MTRKIFIFIFIIFLILASIAGWFYYAGQKTNTQQPVVENNKPFEIKKVIDEQVISPVGAFDNNSIWYFNTNGHLYKVNTDGSNLSEYPLPTLPGNHLRRVIWPKAGSDFIAIAGDDKLQKSYFSSANKVFINLVDNIQYLDWMPDGKRVVYIWKGNDGKNQLVMANADGTGFRNITEVFWPDLVVKASNDGKTVLMYRSNIQGIVNKIYAVNIETGQIITVVENGINTAASWLAIGNKFLYSTAEGKVYLYDIVTRKTTDLKLSTSLDKITSDLTGNVLYAAVAKSDNSGDNFVKITLSSNLQENYFQTPTKVLVKNIMLIGNTVYYTDADNKLYMISR